MQHLSVLFPEEDPRDGSVGPTEPGPGVRDVVSAADPQPLTERTKERCLLPSSSCHPPRITPAPKSRTWLFTSYCKNRPSAPCQM